MMPTGFAKVIVSLVALFVLGGVCGFAVSVRRMSNPDTRAQLEERWIESRRREDARRLQLSPEQAERMRPLYDQMLADIRAVREEAARGVVDAVKKQGRSLWPQLTPEQQQEFQRLSQERLARAQKKNPS